MTKPIKIKDLTQVEANVGAPSATLREIAKAYRKEKDGHLIVSTIFMASQGVSAKSIAEQLGLGPMKVQRWLSSPKVAEKVTQLVSRKHLGDPKKRFAMLVPQAIDRVVSLMACADKDATSLSAAQTILEYGMGKPKQELEIDTGTNVKDLIQAMTELRRDRREQELRMERDLDLERDPERNSGHNADLPIRRSDYSVRTQSPTHLTRDDLPEAEIVAGSEESTDRTDTTDRFTGTKDTDRTDRTDRTDELPSGRPSREAGNNAVDESLPLIHVDEACPSTSRSRGVSASSGANAKRSEPTTKAQSSTKSHKSPDSVPMEPMNTSEWLKKISR